MAQSTRQTKDAKSTKTSEHDNEKQSVGQNRPDEEG
jgi:hypothetical protein